MLLQVLLERAATLDIGWPRREVRVGLDGVDVVANLSRLDVAILQSSRDTGKSKFNLAIVKAYAAEADSKICGRTWKLLMNEFCSRGKESTLLPS